jgi:hypothetical protein
MSDGDAPSFEGEPVVRRDRQVALAPEAEAYAADLARAAYEVALRHGISGPFADLELSLWREMREIVHDRECSAVLVGSEP